MPGLNPTTGAAFLKRFYSPTFIQNAIDREGSRLFAMVPKDTNGSGDSYNFFVDVDGGVASGSADFATAQNTAANNAATIGSQFKVDWVEDHEVVQIDGKFLAQTRNNTGAWTAALKYAMDNAIRYAAHRKSIAFVTEGWGELDVAISGVSGATFACGDSVHIYRFMKGMPLVFSSSKNAAVLRSGTPINVTGVDYTNNLVTCDTNLSTPGGANGDSVFTSGDRQNSATPVRLRPAGFPAWIPNQSGGVTDTTISTLYNVTRSSNTRLYGQWIDGTTQSLQDACIQAAQTCSSIGNATDMVIALAPANFTTLSKSMGSDKRYVDLKGNGGIGFRTISVYADGVEAAVISDKYMGSHAAFLIDRKSFVHASIGPAPHIDSDDGNTILRISNSNGVEGRIVSYECIACKNPPPNAYISLP